MDVRIRPHRPTFATGLADRLGGLLLLAALGGACAPRATLAPPASTPEGTASAAEASPAAPSAPLAEWPDAVLYFAIVDRFADGDPANNREVNVRAKGTFHGGDLRGLTERLDEIAGLGVSVLWITPVVRNIPGFVTGAGFPDWGYHGYWADDFTTLDPRFGTESELRRLVDECHRRGIRVLLDVVYNHAGYGSRYLTDPRTSGWLRSEDRGSCGSDDLTSCLSGLPDFRTEIPAVADYLITAHLGLAKRVGLDGFRLDTVKHVDHPFWQEHRRRTRAELAGDFFLVGEVWGGDATVLDPWFAADEMDAGFDFSFQGSVLGFVQGRGRAVAFDRYLKSREEVRPGHLLAHFLSSHDVPGALHQLGGDRARFRLAAVLQMTTGGIPVVYYGEEVGRPGGDWPDNRSDMPWGDRPIRPGAGAKRDEALRADYRKLIRIRREHRALSRGRHESLAAEGDLLAFRRSDPEDGWVVVAVNRSEAPLQAEIPVGEGAPPDGATVRDVWGDRDVEVAGGRARLSLGALDAAILIPGAR